MASVSQLALAAPATVNGSDQTIPTGTTGIIFQSDNTATLGDSITGDVTTATDGTGTLTMGGHTLTGNVGASGAALKQINLQPSGGTAQISGDIFVRTLNLNDANFYFDNSNSAAAVAEIGDVTTSTNGMGALHLHGGNATITGSVGTASTALGQFSLDSRTASTFTFGNGAAIYAGSIGFSPSGGSVNVVLNGAFTTSGSLSVSNSTVDLKGGTWTHSGNASFTNSTLRSSILSATSQSSCAGAAGCLSVSGGSATTAGTNTVQLRVSAASNLRVGDTYTIIDAPNSNTGIGNVTVSSLTSGYTFAQVANNQDLIIQVTAAPASAGSNYTGKGQVSGANGGNIGSALDRIDGKNTAQAVAFQNSILTAIDSLPTPQEQTKAIKSLAPVQNAPSSQMSAGAAAVVLGAVEQHQQTAMGYDPQTGVSAGSESHDSALWGQFLGGGAIRGTNAEADGYRSQYFGVAYGMDHRFSDNLMGGAALSWLRGWAQGSDDSSGSSSQMDSYQITLYGTFREGQFFVDGQLGAGINKFDQKRAISFLNSIASANYDGQQYLAKGTVGYDVPLANDVVVTPMYGLTWLRAVSDGYTETGAGLANLTVDEHGVNTLSQQLGGKITWKVDSAIGTIKPEARLAWVHDYTKGPVATSGLLAGETFTSTTPRTKPDGARIGLAAGLSSSDDLSFRAEYEAELRQQYQSHTGMVKAIWGF